MRIQHNIMAMNAYRNYTNNTSALSKNLEKLSSGYKINRAGDDAAGLAISEKMRAQITGLEAAQKNVKDGISLVNTAEGAMQEIHDMLNRMVYLATQSANGTYDDSVDRANLQAEVDSLKSEINRIAESANFNGIKLLDGSLSSSSTLPMEKTPTATDLIDGTSPSAGGKATIKVTLDPAPPAAGAATKTTVAASTDTDETYDAVKPNKATAASYTFTIGDPAGTNSSSTKVGAATGGVQVDIATGTNGMSNLKTAKDANGKLLSDLYDITVTKAADGGTVSGWDQTYSFAEGDKITLTSKTLGNTNGQFKTDINALVTDAVGTATYVEGLDEGKAASAETKYEVTMDLTDLAGGQEIHWGGQTIKIINDGTKATPASNEVNIYGLNLGNATDQATVANAIKTALTAAQSAFAAPYAGANGKFTVEQGAIDASGNVKFTMQAADGTGYAGNIGEFSYVSSDDNKPVANSDVVYTKYDPNADKLGKLAQVTYKNDALKADNLKAGSSLKIGNTTINIVAAGKAVNANDIEEGDVATKLAEVIEKQSGTDFGLAQYDKDNGTLVFTGKNMDIALNALKTSTAIQVTGPTPTATAPTTAKATGGLAIEPGTTTYGDLMDHEISVDGQNVKLSDLFDITVGTAASTPNANDIIAAGAEITFTAKQVGKLSDTVMAAVTYNNGATAEVSDGWDEGTTGGGNNTHYELKIDPTKLAGGQTFTFGTDDNAKTFEITYDDIDGDNGTADGDEISGGRVQIALSNTMTNDEIAQKINDTIKNEIGSQFNVKTKINGGQINLSLDAKNAGESTNWGGVRFSSQAGAFSGGVYKAYNATNGGTPGTYAKVSYDFDISKLQLGDKLTIGTTTIEVGAESTTTKNGATTKVTLSEADAKTPAKLIAAFEAAGYQSGQIEIDTGNKKLTITGQTTGETADNLSKNGGKVSLAVASGRVENSNGLNLQIGDTSDSYNQISVSVKDMHVDAMGIGGINIASQAGAQKAISVIKDAINYVSSVRGDLGAISNRLDHTANNLSVMRENIQDAESTIRDTDVAEEMMAYTKNNILVQSAQAMLAQANQVPQGVLQLLG